ncbi:PAX-interacting protein 1 [Cucumis melo var. makuwa]|uniref:PAX-interacting protein 1 n=1 Tax=Cucumis melo var. makuwa TaxID=1194695 RepID=A0A5D3D3Z8_CUCMM|nr:PAX-interacting protein 1 [Cucumis melo var. makuwa]
MVSKLDNDDSGGSFDDFELLQNTLPFEDIVGFDNRVVRLESPFNDTETVAGLDDCSENLCIPTFEYEDDVVLDSEDEGINGSRVIRVSSSLSRNEAEQEVKSDAQEENMALDFHSSDHKPCDAGEQVSSNCFNGLNVVKDSSQLSTRLSYCSSQEPGESTQVNAIVFVDHFVKLSTANVNPSQGLGQRKAARVQSPIVSRIKGPQSLAKRIGRKSIDETGNFEWVEILNQEAECNSFCKCKKSSSDLSNCRGRSCTTKHHNMAKLSNIGDCLLKRYEDEEEANAGIQFQTDSTASTLPPPRLEIYSLEAEGMSNIEIENKSNEETNAKLVEGQFEFMDDERDAPDELDIGFSTQIAAEAMEALCYIPDNDNLANAWSPENALDSVSCSMKEHKPHLNSSYPQTIGGADGKSKRTLKSKRKLNAKCLNTSRVECECQELEAVLIAKSKAKRSRLALQGQSNYRKSPDESNYSATPSNLLSETGSCQLSQRGLTIGDQITTRLMVDLWSHPRGRRTPRNIQSHPNRSKNQNNTSLAVDGSCNNSILMKNGKVGRNSNRKCTSRSRSKFEVYHNTSRSIMLPQSSSKELARLGVSESMPDLKWKDLRRRRTMALVRVCFSQHLDVVTLKQQKKVVLQLGISIASSSVDATHFVADKFVRTRNMLEAIALGKPVVTPSWLESCGQASCFIDEKNYILRDTKKEKEIGFSLPVSLSRATLCPLLQGFKVLVTQNIRPGKEIIASLVKMSQGETIERSQIFTGKNEKFPDNLLILSCEEDYADCVHFLKKGAKVYSSELLLNGIVIQKLENKRKELPGFNLGFFISMSSSQTARKGFDAVNKTSKEVEFLFLPPSKWW